MSDKQNSYNLPSVGHFFVSSNGNGHKQLSPPRINAGHSDERKADLKLAIFCLAVAFALIVAGALGRIGVASVPASDQYSLEDVTLVVRPNNRTHMNFRVSFRLSNMGKHAVFYGISPGTDVPIGQILVEDPSATNQFVVPPDQAPQPVGLPAGWIEMPPGGWIDGEFEDRIGAPGEHVYAVLLKLDRDGPSFRVTSCRYRVNLD